MILETSQRVGQVALARGAQLLSVRTLDESRRHARDLAPAVQAMLHEQGWTPRDVHAIFVDHGPGSYTGLRVGLISAKAYCFAVGCALVRVSALEALAWQAPATATPIEVLIDAQQDRVYVQRFRRRNESLLEETPIQILTFAEWLQQHDDCAWVTGPGLRGKETRLPAEVLVVAAMHDQLKAASLLKLGLPRYLAGQRDDFWTLEPLYLRPSAAEQQWDNKGTR